MPSSAKLEGIVKVVAVEVVIKVRVQLLVRVGGGVGLKKTEINAILNSVGVRIEVGVELGKNH